MMIMMEVGRWGSYPNSPGVGGRGRSPLIYIYYIISIEAFFHGCRFHCRRLNDLIHQCSSQLSFGSIPFRVLTSFGHTNEGLDICRAYYMINSINIIYI